MTDHNLDDSRLIAYAEKHGCRWRWETQLRDDDKWWACAELLCPSAPWGWCSGATEQEALDSTIDLQISTYDYVCLHHHRDLGPSDGWTGRAKPADLPPT